MTQKVASWKRETDSRGSSITAFILLLASSIAMAQNPDFENRCHEEVVELHKVIEGWFAGTLPDTDSAFLEFSDAMADDFEIISPTGSRSDRNAIIGSLRTAYGVRESAFSIAIKNIRTRLLIPPLALLTYEEWQFENGHETARLSTVLLREDPGAPRGISWVHLQETWLPGKSPNE